MNSLVLLATECFIKASHPGAGHGLPLMHHLQLLH